MSYAFFKSLVVMFIICISPSLSAAECNQAEPAEIYFAEPAEPIVVQESLREKSHLPWVKWLMRQYLLRLEKQLENKEIVPVDLVGHHGGILAVAITPDKSKVVTGSCDRDAKIWDGKTGKCLITLHGHSNNILSAAITPDGSRVVTGSVDGSAIVWDGSTGAPIVCLQINKNYFATPLTHVTHVAITADGSKVVTASPDGIARIWDVKSGQWLYVLPHKQFILALAITADGSKVRTVSYVDREFDPSAHFNEFIIKSWNLATGVFLNTKEEIAEESGFKECAITSRGQDFVYIDSYGSYKAPAKIAMSPGGLKFAAGYFDGAVRICTAEAKHDLLILGGHAKSVSAIAISPDGSMVVSGGGGFDKIAKIWNIGDVHAELMKLTMFKQLKFLSLMYDLAQKSDCKIYKLDLTKETKFTGELKKIYDSLPQLLKELIADEIKLS